MRRPMVAGNWKMHGTRASVAELIKGLALQSMPGNVDVAVMPSSLFIGQVIQALGATSIIVGAQDAAMQAAQGALTGEVASSQLADAGCKLVLVGHSERRQLIGEQDDVLNRKFAAIQAEGLTPVLCIGETLEERQAGQTLEVVGRQLDSVIAEFGVEAFVNAVIAYEPVWAIGTGLTASLKRRRKFTQPFAPGWRKRMPKSHKACDFFMAAALSRPMRSSYSACRISMGGSLVVPP